MSDIPSAVIDALRAKGFAIVPATADSMPVLDAVLNLAGALYGHSGNNAISTTTREYAKFVEAVSVKG